jgi:LacI family transcriptional regulator
MDRDRTGKRADIAAVAAAAGVSTATVSRVLNNPAIVRPALRERVQEALRALGYVPNAAARALASNRTRAIGAIVPTLGVSIFAQGVEAMQNALGEAGYGLLLANSQYDLEKEFVEIRTLVERGIDGLVLVGNERLPEARAFLRRAGVPCVVTYVAEAADDAPAVGIDNFRAAYDLAAHLVDLGHRAFAIVTSPSQTNDRIRARRRGLLQCLADRGVAGEIPVLEVPYAMEGGREALRGIAADHPQTTAILCTTDVLAIGALAEARALGLAVPEHLSITGFDDLEFASSLSPALTSVHVPAGEIGETAARRLLGLIAGESVVSATDLGARLVLRDSTAPPRDVAGVPPPSR